MLFLPESLRNQMGGIARQAAAGDLTFEAAAHEMLNLYPENGPAFFLLGQARAEAGDLEAAEELFWQALALDPCAHRSYLVLAELLRRRGADPLLAEGLFRWRCGSSRSWRRSTPRLAGRSRKRKTAVWISRIRRGQCRG